MISWGKRVNEGEIPRRKVSSWNQIRGSSWNVSITIHVSCLYVPCRIYHGWALPLHKGPYLHILSFKHPLQHPINIPLYRQCQPTLNMYSLLDLSHNLSLSKVEIPFARAHGWLNMDEWRSINWNKTIAWNVKFPFFLSAAEDKTTGAWCLLHLPYKTFTWRWEFIASEAALSNKRQ